MASDAPSESGAADRVVASRSDTSTVAALSPRVVTSETLLRGESQLAILHERTVYFLRRTRLGKLILTK